MEGTGGWKHWGVEVKHQKKAGARGLKEGSAMLRLS